MWDPTSTTSGGLETVEHRLRADVGTLAGEIGERNLSHYAELEAAAAHVRCELELAGHDVREEVYEVCGRACRNLWVEIPGEDPDGEIVLAGAHYDSVTGSPGANDNGSGVAAVLELARRFRDSRPRRTLRLVAFTNEEPPHFMTGTMGSMVHAKACRRRGERIAVMISLETIGYYSSTKGSQRFPLPGLGLRYSNRGDYLVFVGNLASRRWVKRAVKTFRAAASFPCEGAALPFWVPGVGWSDQLSFWRRGYRGLMATDTAPFRYPWYHTAGDTPDKVQYEPLAQVVDGIGHVLADWAGIDER